MIIDNIDIVLVLERYLDLKKKGEIYFSLCPFHVEKSSSFVVYPKSKRFFCFGCNKKGNVINFLMDYKKMNFIEVISLLQREFNYSNSSLSFLKKSSFKKERKLERIFEILNLKLFTVVGRQYLQYLINRNFSLRFIKMLKIGCYDKVFLLELKKENFFSFSLLNRVIFPIFDFKTEQLLTFCGRIIISLKSNKYIFLKNNFNKQENFYFLNKNKLLEHYKKYNFLIITEGFFDVLRLASKNYYNVVSLLGSTMSFQQIFLLYSYKITNFLLILDNDNIGLKSNLSVFIKLINFNSNFKIRFFNLKHYKDIDLFLVKNTDKEFRENIVSFSTFLFLRFKLKFEDSKSFMKGIFLLLNGFNSIKLRQQFLILFNYHFFKMTKEEIFSCYSDFQKNDKKDKKIILRLNFDLLKELEKQTLLLIHKYNFLVLDFQFLLTSERLSENFISQIILLLEQFKKKKLFLKEKKLKFLLENKLYFNQLLQDWKRIMVFIKNDKKREKIS